MSLDAKAIEKLEALRKKYADQLASRITEAEVVWGHIEANAEDREALERFHRLVHSLAGSGATFGFPVISEVAHTLESLADTILDVGVAETVKLRKQVQGALAELRKGIAVSDGMQRAGGVRGYHDEVVRRKFLIVIADGDREQAEALGAEIAKFGYDVRVSADPNKLVDGIAKTSPGAVLLSTVFEQGRNYGVELARQIRERNDTGVPIIFISTRRDFNTRLAAARVGCNAYLIKPLRADKVVEKLDLLVGDCALGPYRVLVAHEDEERAVALAAALNDADMVVEVVTEPPLVSEKLAKFDAELILSGTHFTACTGLELGMVIRQHENFEAVPFAFLLDDSDARAKMIAAGLDEQDLIVLPVEPARLVEVVSDRIRQYRIARANRDRDSLTRTLENLTGGEVVAGLSAPQPAPVSAPAVTKGASEPPPAAIGGRRTRVLVVDDDPYILEAVRIRLEAAGMEVIEATGGNEGFAMAYTEMPDVIIADYNMPKGSGEYMLTRLKQSAETADIPVVVITGLANTKEPNHALEREMLGRRGAVAYLAKPLDFDVLMDIMKRHTPR